jgi:glycosyltransferase involved in cell wall biosynthesis
MIEAMACGTPVIAFRNGSVPEIIGHGVTGFVVDDEAEAARCARRIGELDRRRIRAEFERRFSAARMARDYVALYRRLMERATSVRHEVSMPRQSRSDARVRQRALTR